jgi:putative phosphonate metabolism protein
MSVVVLIIVGRDGSSRKRLAASASQLEFAIPPRLRLAPHARHERYPGALLFRLDDKRSRRPVGGDFDGDFAFASAALMIVLCNWCAADRKIVMTAAFQNGDSFRYAIYWAPPERSVLAKLGAAWLGRDAAADRELKRGAIDGFDDAFLAAITGDPRRYGLHATLKPPFVLAGGIGPPEFQADLAAFAARTAPIAAPNLHIARIGNFLALTPSGPAPEIDTLANACVEHFDRYRAPPSQQELARRRSANLTANQERYLERWGYPYVMDEFRFHVSLTGSIERSVADRLLPALKDMFSPTAGRPLEISDIALFAEPAPGAPFRLLRRFALAGQAGPRTGRTPSSKHHPGSR